MSTSIDLPEGYVYVVASLTPIVWLLLWQTVIVYQRRKKSGILYPQLYAEKAEAEASREAYLFNCAQRAHQNTLELLPIMVITTLVTGAKYPIPAASACAFWTLTRILYTFGYMTGDVTKRNRLGGILGEIPLFGLIIASTVATYQLIVGA